jgi:Raf kinase inhibitor-like YbhB/YbcL family protein
MYKSLTLKKFQLFFSFHRNTLKYTLYESHMKSMILPLILLLLITGCLEQAEPEAKRELALPAEEVTVKELVITSPVFENNQYIPSRYTCEGDNINPPLEIAGVPEGTKSLVLIVDDLDAPGGIFNHWVVWNIDPVNMIGENSVPGIEGINGFENHSYGGPCPPLGEHSYVFKVYALDILLDLDSNAQEHEVESAMEGHILAKGELMGLYRKGGKSHLYISAF